MSAQTPSARARFNPWRNDASQPNRAPKPTPADTRNLSAVNRPVPHHFVVTASLDGKSDPILSVLDGASAWDMLHAIPEARSYTDDEGRLLAYRSKWRAAEDDSGPALEPTARRGRGARGREAAE